MFNSHGTAYAADAVPKNGAIPIGKRFVIWFNGNGIPERYWIPSTDGRELRHHSLPDAHRALEGRRAWS
jgi:hypothetical protein